MRWLAILSFVFISSTVYAQSYAEAMARTAMQRWPAGRGGNWSYEPALVLKGMEQVYLLTGRKEYLDYIKQSMAYFISENGEIRHYKPADYNIDNLLGGRNLLMLYKATGESRYKKAADLLRAQLLTHPRTIEGGFWHKKRYTNQMWLDGLYMGQPFYAEYAASFGEDSLFNDIARQFILMEKHATDAQTGLLYHGWDESRTQKWADPVSGRSPHVWARAMGWYGMALVDVLEWFPTTHPKRDSVLDIFKRFASAVVASQDKKSGLWYDVLDVSGDERNYLEASASSMFVYALYKGERLNYLPHKFRKAAKKGYKAIVKNFIREENGQMNLHGTVGVSGLGGDPYRDGSFDYYMSEKLVVNDPKGVGAFLMAAAEAERKKSKKQK